MGVILEYEQITKNKICDLIFKDVEAMTTLIWLMMRKDVPQLTLDDTARLILKTENSVPIYIAAQDAVKSAFTTKKAKSAIPTKSEYFNFGDLIKTAAEVGISDVWELTPEEYTEQIRACIRRRRRERNERFTLAWYTAYFTRVKSLPDLQSILIDVEEPEPKREMTDEEMQEACKLICLAFGGKVDES